MEKEEEEEEEVKEEDLRFVVNSSDFHGHGRYVSFWHVGTRRRQSGGLQSRLLALLAAVLLCRVSSRRGEAACPSGSRIAVLASGTAFSSRRRHQHPPLDARLLFLGTCELLWFHVNVLKGGLSRWIAVRPPALI